MFKQINILIGYGYIGKFIKKNFLINRVYNSKNINQLQNQKKKINKIFISAPSSIKFNANKYPKKDYSNVYKLINILKKINCKHVICISSTDTYSNKNSFENSKIIKSQLNAYGLHRLYLSEFVKKKFSKYTILKLPSLFGYNEKKGFLHDLLTQKKIKYYNSRTFLQWYYVPNLKKDLNKIIKNSKKKSVEVNLVSEPISCEEINKKLNFNKKFLNKIEPVKYNIKTLLYKKKFFYEKKEILKLMKIYLNTKT